MKEPSAHRLEGLPRELQLLIRQLVSSARNSLRNRPGEVILLDVVVGETRCLLEDLAQPNEKRPSLSPRQREIVGRIARGDTNRAIARELHISEWTVKTHIRRAFSKERVGSRSELVARALIGEILTMKSD